MEDFLQAYCVKCKTKREINKPEAVFTKSGTPAVRGVCPVCGTKLYRMGRVEAHKSMDPPEVVSPRKKNRSGKLVIVESPAKARTVKQILGKDYQVQASIGHVRDLLKSKLSVDVENGFMPKYRVPKEKRQVVNDLKKSTNNAAEVFLATDPDREGEAIAWHLTEAVEIEPGLSKRVVFHEITKPAIEKAFNNPREINLDLVDAQQARRILDRLVGYNLSPLLWRKIRGRLSAGRVQSVALRLIVEREREIESFVPVEYWTIEVEFQPDGLEETFIAKLISVDGKDVEFGEKGDVDPVIADMQISSYIIEEIKKGQRKRSPSAPFTTSTLQQEASRRLGLNARRTMILAQQLYEGIDIGNGGPVGLITYMRTDSTQVSDLAKEEAKKFIAQRFGKEYLPKETRDYKTKARRAQEAHEAIRPTDVFRQPGTLKKYLKRDQLRLYRLIWERFVASQMASAVYDTLVVDVKGTSAIHEYLLRVSGSSLKFPGFRAVYKKIKQENNQNNNNDEDIQIPAGIAVDQVQKLIRVIPEQHFTQPPPRFSEASLVRLMEEYGIGRPSTYAPTLATLQQRRYVERVERRLHPTEIGFLVNDLLIENFPDIIEVGFTAEMEDNLDKIASGEMPWVEVVSDFYGPFIKDVRQAEVNIPKIETEPEYIGRNCPKCGHELMIRYGRYGKFISCSNFPACRYTEPWLEKIGVKCPLDGGELVQRKTRKGRTFYGCANYPECDFTSWKRPINTACPNCGGLLVESNKEHMECIECEHKFHSNEINKAE
jgi:DNA topoisomerase-1